MGGWGRGFSELEGVKLEVMARSGNPELLSDLEKVSAGKAHRVLIMPPDDDDAQVRAAVCVVCVCLSVRAGICVLYA